jgi:hypothetical protein
VLADSRAIESAARFMPPACDPTDFHRRLGQEPARQKGS